MQKMQILFPDRLMDKIRHVSDAEEISVSEIVRRATEEWLEKRRFLEQRSGISIEIPLFSGGEIMVSAADIRGSCYDRELRNSSDSEPAVETTNYTNHNQP